jgi:Ca2+-binding EF-hand superfamily protein
MMACRWYLPASIRKSDGTVVKAGVTQKHMQNRILIAATAVLLSLPLASHAADEAKKKGPFVVADTDGDGKVSLTEYVVAMKGKLDETAAKAKFAELDKNNDKSLSREEFNAGSGEKKKGEKKKKDAN